MDDIIPPSEPEKKKITWRNFVRWPLCGPKCAIFAVVMSIWGILFLGVLGVLFYVKYSLLIVDIGYEGETGADFDLKEVFIMFNGCAYNCWIAAGLFLLTGAFAYWQHQVNQKISPSTSNGVTNSQPAMDNEAYEMTEIETVLRNRDSEEQPSSVNGN